MANIALTIVSAVVIAVRLVSARPGSPMQLRSPASSIKSDGNQSLFCVYDGDDDGDGADCRYHLLRFVSCSMRHR